MSAPLLETKKLCKAFGKVVTARDLDLVINQGELTSIIGPNGAGKSTLINMLSGALPVDSGQVLFMGRDITNAPIHARVRMGLCRSFQVVNVFPELSVFDNVLIPVLAQLGRAGRFFSPLGRERAAREQTMEYLELVGLDHVARRRADALSHGDQRMLEVAIALAARPKLLFLDEPTAGMNPVERVQVLENIRRLNDEGRTSFVIVEHDMDIVFSLSQRVLVLYKGEVICDGPPEHVQGHDRVRECYLGQEVE